MLAYAANRRQIGKRESSPNALLLVISAHVALLALAMSAKSEFSTTAPHPWRLIEVPVPPPPRPTRPQPKQTQPQPRNSWIDHTATKVPLPPLPPRPPLDGGGTTAEPGGGGTGTIPDSPQPVRAAPVRHDPQLLTPPWQLKPPYPASKLASEEEATLRLRLTIDPSGRVIAVDPVGSADREFLDSARRYILGHWRYQPASEDGRAVASTITVTLQFRIDG